MSSALISQWKKEKLREQLKAIKKHIDDLDKARKAVVIQKVRFIMLLLCVAKLMSNHYKIILHYLFVMCSGIYLEVIHYYDHICLYLCVPPY